MKIRDMNPEGKSGENKSDLEMHPMPLVEEEWIFIIENHGEEMKRWRRIPGIREKIARGVPDAIRPAVWRLVLEPKIKQNYDMMASKKSEYIQQISADVHRTLSGRDEQSPRIGHMNLQTLLCAVANAMPRIGYCQGMGDICATFLSRYSEEEAFSIFLTFVARERIHGLFDRNLSMLPQIISKQQRVLERTAPRIYGHLRSERVDLIFCVAGWYITLFSRFKKELCDRIWDFLFFYGFWMLPYFAAAILKYHEKKLLRCSGEALLETVGSLSHAEYDPDVIVCLALKLREIDQTMT